MASNEEFPAQYALQSPDIQFDAAYKRLLQTWFHSVDLMDTTPDEEMADCFAEDAVFIFGQGNFTGTAEIIKCLADTRAYLAGRAHSGVQIFPYGPNANSLMLHGTVEYYLKTGRTVPVKFSGYMEVTKNKDGKAKISFYRVWLETYDL